MLRCPKQLLVEAGIHAGCTWQQAISVSGDGLEKELKDQQWLLLGEVSGGLKRSEAVADPETERESSAGVPADILTAAQSPHGEGDAEAGRADVLHSQP